MKGWALIGVVCANALVVFHIILNVEIQSHKHWSWPLVFIPLWVSILFLMAFLVGFLDYKGVYWLLLGVISMLVFTIILPVKLNHPTHSPSWYGVFSPFWLGLAIFLLVDESWPQYSHTYTTPDYENTELGERYLFLFPKLGLVAFAIYAILHSIHLENHYYLSWPVIFSPFLVFTFLLLFTILSNGMYINNSNQSALSVYPLLASIPVISFEILLLMYLMGYIHSFAVANIPLFLCDIIVWIGACVLLCV